MNFPPPNLFNFPVEFSHENSFSTHGYDPNPGRINPAKAKHYLGSLFSELEEPSKQVEERLSQQAQFGEEKHSGGHFYLHGPTPSVDDNLLGLSRTQPLPHLSHHSSPSPHDLQLESPSFHRLGNFDTPNNLNLNLGNSGNLLQTDQCQPLSTNALRNNNDRAIPQYIFPSNKQVLLPSTQAFIQQLNCTSESKDRPTRRQIKKIPMVPLAARRQRAARRERKKQWCDRLYSSSKDEDHEDDIEFHFTNLSSSTISDGQRSYENSHSPEGSSSASTKPTSNESDSSDTLSHSSDHTLRYEVVDQLESRAVKEQVKHFQSDNIFALFLENENPPNVAPAVEESKCDLSDSNSHENSLYQFPNKSKSNNGHLQLSYTNPSTLPHFTGGGDTSSYNLNPNNITTNRKNNKIVNQNNITKNRKNNNVILNQNNTNRKNNINTHVSENTSTTTIHDNQQIANNNRRSNGNPPPKTKPISPPQNIYNNNMNLRKMNFNHQNKISMNNHKQNSGIHKNNISNNNLTHKNHYQKNITANTISSFPTTNASVKYGTTTTTNNKINPMKISNNNHNPMKISNNNHNPMKISNNNHSIHQKQEKTNDHYHYQKNNKSSNIMKQKNDRKKKISDQKNQQNYFTILQKNSQTKNDFMATNDDQINKTAKNSNEEVAVTNSTIKKNKQANKSGNQYRENEKNSFVVNDQNMTGGKENHGTHQGGLNQIQQQQNQKQLKLLSPQSQPKNEKEQKKQQLPTMQKKHNTYKQQKKKQTQQQKKKKKKQNKNKQKKQKELNLQLQKAKNGLVLKQRKHPDSVDCKSDDGSKLILTPKILKQRVDLTLSSGSTNDTKKNNEEENGIDDVLSIVFAEINDNLPSSGSDLVYPGSILDVASSRDVLVAPFLAHNNIEIPVMMDTKNQKKNTKNHNFTNTAQISSSLPMMENDLDQICDHRKSLPNEKALSSPLPQNTMMSVEYEPNTEIICVDSTSAPPLSESFVEVWGENFSIEYVLRFFHELPAKKQEPLRIVSSQEIIDSMMTMQDLCCKCVTCLERVENKLHMTYDIFYQNLANGCLSRVATETLKLECAGNKSGMRAEDRAVRLAEVDLRDDQRHIVENAQELLEALRKIAVTNVSPPGEPTQLSQKIGEKPHKDLKNHILPEDITRMDDTIEDNEFLGTLRCETPFCGTSLTPEKEILPYDDIQCATHLECELEFERYLPNSEGKNWTELLAAMNLDSFADTFEAEGWDDIDLWPEMTDEDLLDLGFKKEDVFKWRTLYIVNEISDYESDFSEEDSDIRLTPTNCVLNLAPLTIQQVASKIVHDRIYSAYSENLAHQKQMALLLECEEEEAQKERRRQKRKQKRQKRRRKKKAKKNETN